MATIRYAASIALAAAALTAAAAPAQTAMQMGGANVLSMSDAGLSAPRLAVGERGTAPARRGSTNPHPAAAEALRVRLGCAEGDAFQAERGRFRSAVRVGMDACVALARYGQPSSVTISDFGHTELVTMVWGNRGGSYGVHVAAVTYKDHPLTHQAGKADEIGRWRITRVFGTERR